MGSVISTRVDFISKQIGNMDKKIDKLLDEDSAIERRLQKLEDMNLHATQLKVLQLELRIERQKTIRETKDWFWAKIAAVVTGVSSIVVSVWIFFWGLL